MSVVEKKTKMQKNQNKYYVKLVGGKFVDSESVCTVPFVMMMPLNVDLLIKDSIKHGISVQS